MVSFFKWTAVTFAPDTVRHTDTTSNDHVDFRIIRQMQSLFHQPAVKPFKRTRIISGLTHCQHESLGSQSTALVYADTYVSFAHLAHYRPEQTYALRQGFAEKSQQTEEARIDKGISFV